MNKVLEQQLKDKYEYLFEYAKEGTGHPIYYGADCGDGWYKLLDELMENIIKIDIDKKVRISQVKEKFGGLRFYIKNGNDDINNLIHDAENMSYSICEYCGTKNNIGSTSGWIKNVCKKCFDEKMSKGTVWTPRIPLKKMRKLKINNLYDGNAQ